MITEMKLEHMEGVLEIEKLCFPVGMWTEESYIYELEENPFSKMYVCIMDDKIVGVACTYIMFDQAQISTIGVHPKYQRRGIAKQLMDHMEKVWIEEACEFCTLEVRVSNSQAIALYESYGFINLNLRKSYYEDGEDAYVMGKAIGGSYE